ncbi:MAG: hypothetical protein LKJ81_05050 [Bacilli bacterium]|nr:hypothetical protein [Bacilli bacterium]
MIIVWILVVIVIIYLAGFFYLLINISNFKNSMEKRVVGLSFIFAEKKDILLSLYTLYDKASVPLDDSDNDAAAKVRWLKTDVMKDDDVETINETLNALQRRLTLLAESQSYIKKSNDFVNYVSALKDLDANYHRIVALYNNDLVGYNYWRRVVIYRFLWDMFGFKDKKRLS